MTIKCISLCLCSGISHVKIISSSGLDKEDYLDVYEDVSIQLKSSTYFNELSDISTSYFGKIPIKQSDIFQREESVPIDVDSHTILT